ncbi:NAD(P)-dependent alcohol dehydrogenase [Rhodococcus sp. YH3-3]|uniref:NAD(P)-dependent alcohol dehydrogenase n=1 Tax=Rhodococcus sp. YH3-3 TaxID=1803579 RepID=UPI0007DB457D|nr:NAD(P)-dependent alcohol dehydrogenase [Rhodococcus sp. YH3-3]
MKITAAVTVGPNTDFDLREVTIGDPRDNEVLVQIKGVGLCHTDIAARDGVYGLPYPLVLGHEGSGVVVSTGSGVTKVSTGDHVAISFNSCGECTPCTKGSPAYCSQFAVYNYIGSRPDGTNPLGGLPDGELHGHFFGQSSLASHAMASERNVVKIDKSIPLELVGPLGCGIQTGAGAVMRSMACPEGSTLLVLGAGPVGLAAVLGGVVQKCSKIIVSEPHAGRRDLALELGATHVLDPAAGALTERVREICSEGVDFAFDTTGNVGVLKAAIESIASMGTLGLVGVPSDFSVDLPINIVAAMQGGLTVKGIVEGDSDPDEFIPELLDLYRVGKFPFDKMITTFPMSDINKAVTAQHDGEVTKVVLVND